MLSFFNVAEKVGSIKEKIDHDKLMYNEICLRNGVLNNDDIQSIYRIGKMEANKMRPLVIKTNAVTKSESLNNARKLRDNNPSRWVKSRRT